jgi:hypothetical protein
VLLRKKKAEPCRHTPAFHLKLLNPLRLLDQILSAAGKGAWSGCGVAIAALRRGPHIFALLDHLKFNATIGAHINLAVFHVMAAGHGFHLLPVSIIKAAARPQPGREPRNAIKAL